VNPWAVVFWLVLLVTPGGFLVAAVLALRALRSLLPGSAASTLQRLRRRKEPKPERIEVEEDELLVPDSEVETVDEPEEPESEPGNPDSGAVGLEASGPRPVKALTGTAYEVYCGEPGCGFHWRLPGLATDKPSLKFRCPSCRGYMLTMKALYKVTGAGAVILLGWAVR